MVLTTLHMCTMHSDYSPPPPSRTFHLHQPCWRIPCPSSYICFAQCSLHWTRATLWVWTYLLVSAGLTNGCTVGDNDCPQLEEFRGGVGSQETLLQLWLNADRPTLVKAQARSLIAPSSQLRRLGHVPVHPDFILLFSLGCRSSSDLREWMSLWHCITPMDWKNAGVFWHYFSVFSLPWWNSNKCYW